MSEQGPDVSKLLQAAEEEGVFSPDSLDVMKAGDLGPMIQAGLGVPASAFKSSQSTLVACVVDDSTSITWIDPDPGHRDVDGPEAVCLGQRTYIDAFRGSKQRDSILMATYRLNQEDPVHPFVNPEHAVQLENGVNYVADGCTPLYRRVCGVLSTIALKMEVDFADAGCNCRAWFLIVTDGRDEDYNRPPGVRAYTPAHCRTLIDDLGERLIVQGMGIRNPRAACDFREIFLKMGISENQIMTPNATPSDIRRAFQVSSQSALTASQGAQSFSQVAQQGVGGFGTGGND